MAPNLELLIRNITSILFGNTFHDELSELFRNAFHAELSEINFC